AERGARLGLATSSSCAEAFGPTSDSGKKAVRISSSSSETAELPRREFWARVPSHSRPILRNRLSSIRQCLLSMAYSTGYSLDAAMAANDPQTQNGSPYPT